MGDVANELSFVSTGSVRITLPRKKGSTFNEKLNNNYLGKENFFQCQEVDDNDDCERNRRNETKGKKDINERNERNARNERENVLVGYVTAGNYFGDFEFGNSSLRIGNYQATENTSMLSIDYKTLQKLIDENYESGCALQKDFRIRCEKINSVITSIFSRKKKVLKFCERNLINEKNEKNDKKCKLSRGNNEVCKEVANLRELNDLSVRIDHGLGNTDIDGHESENNEKHERHKKHEKNEVHEQDEKSENDERHENNENNDNNRNDNNSKDGESMKYKDGNKKDEKDKKDENNKKDIKDIIDDRKDDNNNNGNNHGNIHVTDHNDNDNNDDNDDDSDSSSVENVLLCLSPSCRSVAPREIWVDGVLTKHQKNQKNERNERRTGHVGDDDRYGRRGDNGNIYSNNNSNIYTDSNGNNNNNNNNNPQKAPNTLQILMREQSNRTTAPFQENSLNMYRDGSSTEEHSNRYYYSLYLIHPNDRKKLLWNFMIDTSVLFTVITVPLEVAYVSFLNDSTKNAFFTLNYIIDSLFLLDIFINFRTTFYSKKNDDYITDTKAIAYNYLSSWFLLDFLSVIPIVTKILTYSNVSVFSTETFTALQLVKFAKLFRVFNSNNWIKLSTSDNKYQITISQKSFRIAMMLFQVTIFIIFTAPFQFFLLLLSVFTSRHLYHFTSFLIISYHFISFHVIFYHFISSYVILYCIHFHPFATICCHFRHFLMQLLFLCRRYLPSSFTSHFIPLTDS